MGLSAVLVDFSVRFYLSRGVDVIFTMHISRLTGKDINFMYGEVDFLLHENRRKKTTVCQVVPKVKLENRTFS